MHGRFTSRILVFALLISWFTLPADGAERRRRQIEFSKPRTEIVSTNLQETNAKKLEETLLRQRMEPGAGRPAELFDEQGSFDAPVLPPAPSALSPAQRKRLKELLDRRRNWVYLSVEELGLGWETEEKLGLSSDTRGPGRREKPSVFERFFERLKRETELRAGKALPDTAGKYDAVDLADKKDADSPGARRVTEAEQSLRTLFDTQPAGDLFPNRDQPGSFSDLWGQSWTWTGYTRPDADRKARLEEFKRLLEPARDVSSQPAWSSTKVGQIDRSAAVQSWTPSAAPALPNGVGHGAGSDTFGKYGSSATVGGVSAPVTPAFNPPPRAREPLTLQQLPAGPPRRNF